MKKFLFTLAILAVLPFASEARSLWAYLTYSTFNSPEGPYVETYLTVAGNSVKFIPGENGKFQAAVNIVMIFKQGDQIKAFKKYTLNSPEIADTNKLDFNFVDQQRFQLENGTYTFEIQLADKNKEIKSMPYTQDLIVDFPADKPSISGIELVRSSKEASTPSILTKSGRDLEPYVFTFYPERETELKYYTEIYNMDKVIPADQKFLISCYLETAETGYKLNDYAIIRKEVAKPVNVILYSMDIRNLASGNYNLVVEVRNQNNEVVASNQVWIQRSNPNITLTLADYTRLNTANTFVDKITNTDTLREYIRSTWPIAGGIENQFVKQYLTTSDLKLLQQYFLGFWQHVTRSIPRRPGLPTTNRSKRSSTTSVASTRRDTIPTGEGSTWYTVLPTYGPRHITSQIPIPTRSGITIR